MKHNANTISTPSEDRFQRLPKVLDRAGISKTTAYRLIREGKFPSPVKLGPRTSAWRASEITAWMDAQGGMA